MREILITKIDHGKTFEVILGSLLIIQLSENPTTGFRWKIIDINNIILALKDSNYSISPNSALGGGGTRTFVLDTLTEGSSKIGLKLLQYWDPQNFADSFIVTIHVKKV